jgi:ribosomal protein S18 acetylase RimI-like enzyme
MSDRRTPSTPSSGDRRTHSVSSSGDRRTHSVSSSGGSRPESVRVRTTTSSDYPIVLEMIQALAAHIGADEKPNVTVEVLERDGPQGHGNFQILVAELEGKICGLCLYTFAFSGWRGMSGLFIEDLYVAPSARGLGIGKTLLNEALAREKQRGAGYIKLEVTISDEAAVRFYTKLGFKKYDDIRTMIFVQQ